MVPLGIDKEKIILQLGRLEEHLTRLREISDRITDSEEDFTLLTATERLIQIAIEDCLNIGSHIIAGLRFKRADTYKEVFVRLKEEGILPETLGLAMEGFASFRNRLVHIYYEVTKEEVISKLREIDSFKEFAKQILKYVERE